MILIGLSGKIGTGKSTLAAALQKRLPGSAIASFGAPLKDEAAHEFGFDRELCDTIAGKNTIVPLTGEQAAKIGKAEARVRELLQWVGADRRARNPDYWLWCMDHVLVECLGNRVPVVIIDDVRLAGEANLVLGWTRGQLFRLDPYPGWEPGPDAGDVTEVDLDAWERWTDCYAPGFGELDDVADCIVSLVEVA